METADLVRNVCFTRTRPARGMNEHLSSVMNVVTRLLDVYFVEKLLHVNCVT